MVNREFGDDPGQSDENYLTGVSDPGLGLFLVRINTNGYLQSVKLELTKKQKR